MTAPGARGYGSKEEFNEWLMKNSKTPAWLYWDTHRNELADAKASVEPYGSYLKLGDDADIRFVRTGAGSASVDK